MTDLIAEELAIRELVARYADAVNRYDEDLWQSTWAESGVWSLPALTVEGRDSVVDLWRTAMASFEFALQLVYQGTVTIDADIATGRWYLTETLRPQGADADRTTIGTYEDEYVKQDGSWLFSRRKYHVLYESAQPKGSFTPV